MILTRIRLLLIFLLLSLFATAARASLIYTPNTYGVTTRSMAMGNALAADDQDIADCYYNPAGLASAEKHALQFGYTYTMPFLEGGPEGGDRVKLNDNNRLVYFGFRANIGKLFHERLKFPPLGIGFQVAVDDNFMTMMVFDDMRTDKGNFNRYGLSNLSMQGGLGIGITKWMSLGIGFHGGFRGWGEVVTEADVNGTTSNEGTKMRGAMRPRPLGSLYFHGEKWSIGLAYREETYGTFEPIDVKATPAISGLELAEMDLELNFFDTFVPREATVGVSWQIVPEVLWLAETSWRQWSRYEKEAGNSTYVGSLARFDTIDIWTPRTGLEAEPIEDFKVRAGYRYEQTPFRTIGTRYPAGSKDILGTVVLDNDTHVASLGCGYIFNTHSVILVDLTLDFAYQLHYFTPREAKTSDNYVFDSEGHLHLMSGSFGFAW